MPNKRTSRRNFIRKAALGAGALVLPAQATPAAAAERSRILSALGDTIIPSKTGDPGFKDLEAHGITEQVNKNLAALKDQLFATFNQASAPFFQGRTFVELNENERAEFLKRVIRGEGFTNPSVRTVVQRVYKFVRITVLRIYYSNFPEDKVARDADGIPSQKPGDLHQITTPNTTKLVTGWDVAGYRGPLTWEQEERMRAEVQKVHWHDGLEDLVVRYRSKS